MTDRATGTARADLDSIRAVADAVLYEGYLLYPYRRSSGKNRVRWQFGVLLPPDWARAHGLLDSGVAGSAESWWQRTECLVEAPDDAVLRLRVRFLQVQRKTVEERLPDGTHREVGGLDLGEGTELGFDEAVPREYEVETKLADLFGQGRRFGFGFPGGKEHQPLTDGGGLAAGRAVRRRWPVSASLSLSAAPAETPHRLVRLRVHLENTGRSVEPKAPRDEALRYAMVATHVLLGVDGGSFLSLLDPPEWARAAAEACSNVHAFPVLAGEPGRGDLVLSAPILLPDHPRIAPESPGDLHDATEIDELLSLRTLTLTEAEKREARGTDPRAARIVNRVDTMPPEVLSRLHGAVRSLRPVAGGKRWQDGGAQDGGGRSAVPWWDPGADASVSPETDTVTVAGRSVSRGSRVRLRPRRHGADPHDVFLDGRTARVEAVLLDVDGKRHVAVTLDDDPAAELNQWYGRYRYFSPDEVDPLDEEASR